MIIDLDVRVHTIKLQMSTDPHDIEDEESPQRGKRKAQMGLNQRRKNLTVLEDTSKKK